MDLQEFFEYIYGAEEGYFCVATQGEKDTPFVPTYFHWPTEKEAAIALISQEGEKKNTWFTPALFSKRSHKRDDVKGSRFVFVDFDGTKPDVNNFLGPSLRIQTSSPYNEHWYWDLGGFHDGNTIETINKALAYFYGADTSGWDAGQLLRVPATVNINKGGMKTRIVHASKLRYSLGDFSVLPAPDPDIPIDLTGLPLLEDIVAKQTWSDKSWDLFKNGTKDRSKGLMLLAHLTAESGFSPEEIFVVIAKADDNWGKFIHRSDRVALLRTIVSRAIAKVPSKLSPVGIGILSFLKKENKLKWYIPGLIHENSYTLISGPTGLGKSTFSLSLMQHLLLGKSPVGLQIEQIPTGPVAYFSLEMPDTELRDIVAPQITAFSEKEQQTLEEKLQLFDFGHAIDFAQPQNQRFVNKMVSDGYSGFIFDTWGSSCKSLMTEESVKPVADWIDDLKSKGVFVLFLHHPRKGLEGGRKPRGTDDIYGSHYISSRASAVISMWKEGDDIEIEWLKSRSYTTPKPIYVLQDRDRHFRSGVKDNSLKLKRTIDI